MLFLWCIGIRWTSKGSEESGVNLLIEEYLIWDLSINSRGWTSCSNISSSGHCISPEGFGELGLLKHRVCKSGQCLVHSFCESILLWRIWGRCFMKCSISFELVLECLVDIFSSSIAPNSFDIGFGMVLLAYFRPEHSLDVLFPLVVNL